MRRGGKDAREFFDSAAGVYDELHYAPDVRSFMSVRLERMLDALEALELPRGARVLDAGCGPGRMLEPLARQGFHAVGGDTSREMLGRARQRLRAGGHAQLLARASIEALPFADATFDVVCAAGVLEYLPDDRPALLELRRVLRHGGHLVLPITNLWSPAGLLDPTVEYLKRRPALLARWNRLWSRGGRPAVRPRAFPVRRQRPRAVRELLAELGFAPVAEGYFHVLPWPHPFDRLFPGATAALGRVLEPLVRTPLAPVAEGWLTVARRADGAPDPRCAR